MAGPTSTCHPSISSRAPRRVRGLAGFAIGQRVCAAHTIVVPRNETPIKKGELGVFKGPILPYDRAVSEGIAQIVWDCGPTTPLTVSIRDVAVCRVVLKRTSSGCVAIGGSDVLQCLQLGWAAATESVIYVEFSTLSRVV